MTSEPVPPDRLRSVTGSSTSGVPERLDRHLVSTGQARSRTLAQRLIAAGSVRVDGRVADRASTPITPGRVVEVTAGADSDYVGRGALKLVHALETWGPSGLRVTGRRCLDVGASTGGFTQILLQHGASHVTALDVGHDQLVPELAQDPRVTDLPGTNIRDVTSEQVGTFDLVVGDLSFISLTLVLPPVTGLLEPGADLVVLVKPQFEVGRERLGHGGVVSSSAERARALRQVINCATELGLGVRGLERSPVRGTHGNTEHLLWLARSAPGMMSPGEIVARLDALTQEDD